MLNSQSWSWTKGHASVPRGSILASLLFVIYIKDLSDDFSSNTKLFVDDISIFSAVNELNTTENKLNDELKYVNDSDLLWKLLQSKQTHEVIFNCNSNKPTHPSLVFYIKKNI